MCTSSYWVAASVGAEEHKRGTKSNKRLYGYCGDDDDDDDDDDEEDDNDGNGDGY